MAYAPRRSDDRTRIWPRIRARLRPTAAGPPEPRQAAPPRRSRHSSRRNLVAERLFVRWRYEIVDRCVPEVNNVMIPPSPGGSPYMRRTLAGVTAAVVA